MNPAEQSIQYRTSEQAVSGEHTDSRTQWSCRLSSLPEEQQTMIAKKYYGGKKPWKEYKDENRIHR